MLFWIFEVFPVILLSFNYISRLLVSYLCVYIYRTSLFKRRWEGKSSSKLIRIDDEKFCQTMGETKERGDELRLRGRALFQKVWSYLLQRVLFPDNKYRMQAYMGGYVIPNNNNQSSSDWDIHLLEDLSQ